MAKTERDPIETYSNLIYGYANQENYITRFEIFHEGDTIPPNYYMFDSQESEYLGNIRVTNSDGDYNFIVDNGVIRETTQTEKENVKSLKQKDNVKNKVKNNSKAYKQRGFSFQGKMLPAEDHDLIHYQNLYIEFKLKGKLKNKTAYRTKEGDFFEIKDNNVEQLCDTATEHIFAVVYSNDELLDEVDEMPIEDLETFEDTRLTNSSEVARLVANRQAKLS